MTARATAAAAAAAASTSQAPKGGRGRGLGALVLPLAPRAALGAHTLLGTREPPLRALPAAPPILKVSLLIRVKWR